MCRPIYVTNEVTDTYRMACNDHGNSHIGKLCDRHRGPGRDLHGHAFPKSNYAYFIYYPWSLGRSIHSTHLDKNFFFLIEQVLTKSQRRTITILDPSKWSSRGISMCRVFIHELERHRCAKHERVNLNGLYLKLSLGLKYYIYIFCLLGCLYYNFFNIM